MEVVASCLILHLLAETLGENANSYGDERANTNCSASAYLGNQQFTTSHLVFVNCIQLSKSIGTGLGPCKMLSLRAAAMEL
jgi:hypothetical protein